MHRSTAQLFQELAGDREESLRQIRQRDGAVASGCGNASGEFNRNLPDRVVALEK